MKNTLEQKAKFFALYWGQEVMSRLNNGKGRIDNTIVNHASMSDWKNSASDYLQLKPLSSITDDEAIEVAKMLYLKHQYPELIISWIRDFFNSDHEQRRYDLTLDKVEKIISFLRSKGYALPFMGISVEQMIEWKWIQIVE